MGIDNLIAQIEEQKSIFYKKYGCHPNMLSIGKQQIRQLSEYSYLAKNAEDDLTLAEVKEYANFYSHLRVCGLHVESLLTPIGACIFKGNRELEPQTYYESNRESQFKALPEDELTVRYLPPDFSWLEQHTDFSKSDIEAFKNDL